jgi:hypothetical protein
MINNSKLDIFDGPGLSLLSCLHRLMTESEKNSREYTKASEQIRCLGMAAIGFLQLVSWIDRERPFSLNPLADIGVFVQEHLLGVLPENVLQHWFPGGVFLAVPDVFPKKSAEKILKGKEYTVTPIVWNLSAYDELINQGLNPILCSPFLPEGITGSIDFKEKPLQRKIVVKSSGSGIPDEWLKSLINYAQSQNLSIEIWLPDKRIVITDGKENEEYFSGNPLEKYLESFYQSLVEEPPQFLISYPSEMVQVAAWMRKNGWEGVFGLFPPRGAHEQRNSQWAQRFLKTLVIDPNQLSFDAKQIKEPEGDLESELGKEKIAPILSRFRRDYRLNRNWINRYVKGNGHYWQQIAQEYASKIEEVKNLSPKDQIKVLELLLNFGSLQQGIAALLNLIKRYYQAENWEREQFQEAFRNLDLKSEQKNLFLQEVLRKGEFNDEQINDLISFCFSEINIQENLALFGVLEKWIDFIRGSYQIDGIDLKRKVNEKLFLRHVLKAAVYAGEIYSQIPADQRQKIDYEILILASLLHDWLEISDGLSIDIVRENLRNSGLLNDQQLNLLVNLLERLTPKTQEIKDEAFEEYLKRKEKDFLQIWNEEDEDLRRYLRVIKTADVMANFEETINDLEEGLKDGRMKHPLWWRAQVFWQRLNFVEEEFEFFRKKINDLKTKFKRGYKNNIKS